MISLREQAANIINKYYENSNLSADSTFLESRVQGLAIDMFKSPEKYHENDIQVIRSALKSVEKYGKIESLGNGVILALDGFESPHEAAWAAGSIKGLEWVKVGTQLFSTRGKEAVSLLNRQGYRVMLDLKLHDIPKTVASTIKEIDDSGAELVTVHASGGEAMVRAAVGAASKVKIVAVTKLTSLSTNDLIQIGFYANSLEKRLSVLAGNSGVKHFVAPSRVASQIKNTVPGATVISPGIRLIHERENSELDHSDNDLVTPSEAIAYGADMIVVSRLTLSSVLPFSKMSSDSNVTQDGFDWIADVVGTVGAMR